MPSREEERHESTSGAGSRVRNLSTRVRPLRYSSACKVIGEVAVGDTKTTQNSSLLIKVFIIYLLLLPNIYFIYYYDATELIFRR